MCDVSCKRDEGSPKCTVQCFDSAEDNTMVAAAIASVRNAKCKTRRLRMRSASETSADIPLDYVREAFDKEPDEEKVFLRWKLNQWIHHDMVATGRCRLQDYQPLEPLLDELRA